nr:MAG TPA: helix-turn-helix domain protein [Caudoviricetes sp.]
MNVGKRIKARRKELEMTADDLAMEIGKSRATVYRYENGDIEDMPITVIEPLASALKTTPDYLMGWDDDPNDYNSDDFGDIDARQFNGDVKKSLEFQKALEEDHNINEEPLTIAAHFDGDEYTEAELEKIKEFAAFVKASRK